MQDRFTTWGENQNSEGLLLAVLFDQDKLLARLYVYPKKSLEKEHETTIIEDWGSGKEVDLPDAAQVIERSLSEDSILPEDILIKETGKLRRMQNEWAYHVLSNKLWQSFLDELEQLKSKADELKDYSADIFDQSKSLWERLLAQKRDRNISQEKLDTIKGDLNAVFDKLKELRKEHIKHQDQESIKIKDKFDEQIAKIQALVKADNANYRDLFEKLKLIQADIRKERMRKAHKQNLFDTVSKIFEELSSKRKSYGAEKVQRRLQGLEEVLAKMERSLDRDRKDLDYQNRRADHPGTSQLEAQLRQAKINLIQDKIRSKEEKLADIINTYEKLKKRNPERDNANAGKENSKEIKKKEDGAKKTKEKKEPGKKQEGNKEDPIVSAEDTQDKIPENSADEKNNNAIQKEPNE
ncbi:MAG: hypothetical protein HKN92_11335 [Chitinophagales bacterium]|nr:hypothetical protein [Chitinophagales bacterium]